MKKDQPAQPSSDDLRLPFQWSRLSSPHAPSCPSSLDIEQKEREKGVVGREERRGEGSGNRSSLLSPAGREMRSDEEK
jgi:hypothetical protein